MAKFYIPFMVALLISYIATPFAKLLATKIGAIDVPKDNRRVHKTPIPRLGGLAIYLGTIISMMIFLPFTTEKIAIMVGATIIVITGIFDDVKPMPAKVKLLFQVLAAYVLVLGGVKIEFITNPFGSELLKLNVFAVPITIFWIVGITNTVNLIDGLDGLSAGVSAIASLSMLFVAYQFGYVPIMIMSAILAGSAFGFLPHNFNPAKIFMGDTGALFLGFMLSVIAIEGVMKSVAAIAIALPVLVLGVPIFDTAFAIFRRLLNKRPIMEADKGHLHHRLLDKGLSQKQTVLVLYVVSGLLGAFAVMLAGLQSSIGILLIGVVFTLVIVGTTRVSLEEAKKSKQLKESKK